MRKSPQIAANKCIVFLIALIFTGCGIPARVEMKFQMRRYSGDGTIRACSNVLSSGYAIRFADFDSGHNHSASYELSHVPRISGCRHDDPFLYLRFQWGGPFYEWTQIQKRLRGEIWLILRDKQGRTLSSNELSLSDATFAGTGNLYGAYDPVKTRLHFTHSGNYVLQVTYVPGPDPIPAPRLYFEIDNCAYY